MSAPRLKLFAGSDIIDVLKDIRTSIRALKRQIPQIDAGQVSGAPVANTPTAFAVVFNVNFDQIPIVVACAQATVPGSHIMEVSVEDITTVGCNVYVFRDTNTTTKINWIATPALQH